MATTIAASITIAASTTIVAFNTLTETIAQFPDFCQSVHKKTQTFKISHCFGVLRGCVFFGGGLCTGTVFVHMN